MTDTPVAPTLADLTEPAPDPSPADWNDDGVVILPGLLDTDLVDAYCDEWLAANGGDQGDIFLEPEGGEWAGSGAADAGPLWVLNVPHPGGWEDDCPYMRYPALRDIVCDLALAEVLEGLLGEPAGVHLNLTGWVSTQRQWHQDGYLNPEHVGDSYAAVWIALGDVHPDSGTFQYIPGSHRWHRLTRERIAPYVDLSSPSWPADTETILTPLVEAEVDARGVEILGYAPSAGDVLVWHPRLYHQGAAPLVPNAYRPALIAHYSGIRHRPDMPAPAVQHGRSGWYFPIEQPNKVRR
jgi:hypothetical protein